MTLISITRSCQLVKLDLSHCLQISDENLNLIAQSSLRTLLLAGCFRITTAGVRCLLLTVYMSTACFPVI
jgi:hypothetical protein